MTLSHPLIQLAKIAFMPALFAAWAVAEKWHYSLDHPLQRITTGAEPAAASGQKTLAGGLLFLARCCPEAKMPNWSNLTRKFPEEWRESLPECCKQR